MAAQEESGAFARLRNGVSWARARIEVLVPALALPVFFSMTGSGGGHRTPGVTTLIWGLAAAYVALVVWSPMALPAKDSQPITWAGIKRAATIVVPVMLAATLILVGLYLLKGPSSSSSGFVSALLLATLLGTLGLAAEGSLPVDLFPEFRRRELRRVLYAIVAALFLTLLSFLWEELFSSFVAHPVGAALGEVEPALQETASNFDAGNPLILLVNLLIGAGLFEEMLFRLGIMTLVWALTRRWGWGLLASALCFGLYHISPLSGLGAYNLQTAPVIAVLSSFGMGLATGVIYRYRGFTTAVLAHGLGDWLVVLIMAGTGT